MDGPQSSDGVSREQMLLRVGTALRAVVQGLGAAREAMAREQHIHPTDLRCLAYLDSIGEPISPKAIIAEIGLTSGSGTALLDRLENAGYIRRVPNPEDRRSVLVELNATKSAKLLSRYRKIEETYREATAGFDGQELLTIMKFLDEMDMATQQLFKSHDR